MMAIETTITQEMIDEYTSKGFWGKPTARDSLRQRVKEFPDRVAVIDRERRVTFRELDEMSDRLALSFSELDIQKEDIVCIQLPNTIEAVTTFFALIKAGAIVVAFPILYRSKEVHYILKLTRASVFIIPERFKGFDYLKMARELSADLPDLEHIVVSGGAAPPGTHSLKEMLETGLEEKYPSDYLRRIEIKSSDIAQIFITAGTEAEPKAPMWTHNIVGCITPYMANSFRITKDSVVFCAVPISSGFGGFVGCFLAIAYTGATLVVLDKFEAGETLEWIEKEKVTHLLAVSAQMISMLNVPDLEKHDFSSFESWISFGAPLPAPVAMEARSRMGCRVYSGYGSTEGVVMIPHWDDPLEVVTETVGRAVPGCEIIILDDNGQEVPPGEDGELCAKGPTVFGGYYGRPDLTKKSRNQEGWFFTGDRALIDDNGNVRIVGRKKDMILRGGMNISAEEIEDLLLTHPKVLNTSVVAMPDHRMGEKVCAFIVPKKGESIVLEEAVSFLRDKQLAVYKLPERVELVDELPITPAGKVQKRFLRERIAKKLETEGH